MAVYFNIHDPPTTTHCLFSVCLSVCHICTVVMWWNICLFVLFFWCCGSEAQDDPPSPKTVNTLESSPKDNDLFVNWLYVKKKNRENNCSVKTQMHTRFQKTDPWRFPFDVQTGRNYIQLFFPFTHFFLTFYTHTKTPVHVTHCFFVFISSVHFLYIIQICSTISSL